MSFSCVKHPMTMGEYICGECGHQFCPECVVFPFGPSKLPMCIACALELGGVRRQSTGRPKLARKSIRERLSLQQEQQRAALSGDEVPEQSEPQPELAEPGTPPVTTPEDDAWLEGHVDADDLPGGWSRSF